jgi:hypothetical protein
LRYNGVAGTVSLPVGPLLAGVQDGSGMTGFAEGVPSKDDIFQGAPTLKC